MNKIIKQAFILTLLSAFTFISACHSVEKKAETEPLKSARSENENTVKKGDKELVLVELFTSEG